MRAASLALAFILISASAAFAAEPMVPSDIQATFFDGKPFTAARRPTNKSREPFTPPRAAAVAVKSAGSTPQWITCSLSQHAWGANTIA